MRHIRLRVLLKPCTGPLGPSAATPPGGAQHLEREFGSRPRRKAQQGISKSDTCPLPQTSTETVLASAAPDQTAWDAQALWALCRLQRPGRRSRVATPDNPLQTSTWNCASSQQRWTCGAACGAGCRSFADVGPRRHRLRSAATARRALPLTSPSAHPSSAQTG